MGRELLRSECLAGAEQKPTHRRVKRVSNRCELAEVPARWQAATDFKVIGERDRMFVISDPMDRLLSPTQMPGLF